MHKLRALAASLLPDALVILGVGAVTWGAKLIYEPAGWITGGVLAIAFGFLGGKR